MPPGTAVIKTLSLGGITKTSMIKLLKTPFFWIRSDHQGADSQCGTIRVPSASEILWCLITFGTRKGGGKSQLFSTDQVVVKASMDSAPGFGKRLQVGWNFPGVGELKRSTVWAPT